VRVGLRHAPVRCAGRAAAMAASAPVALRAAGTLLCVAAIVNVVNVVAAAAATAVVTLAAGRPVSAAAATTRARVRCVGMKRLWGLRTRGGGHASCTVVGHRPAPHVHSSLHLHAHTCVQQQVTAHMHACVHVRVYMYGRLPIRPCMA